eukprot:m.923359 g.923359  ORF g.923359 m.923359 type:complete len:392 (-) comp23766_c1_seq4:504-1679(-)
MAATMCAPCRITATRASWARGRSPTRWRRRWATWSTRFCSRCGRRGCHSCAATANATCPPTRISPRSSRARSLGEAAVCGRMGTTSTRSNSPLLAAGTGIRRVARDSGVRTRKKRFRAASVSRPCCSGREVRLIPCDQSASAVAALGKYGLGTRRSLQEYISFCGIDTIKQQIAANCVVKYQPWDWSHAEAMSGYKDVIARRHGGVPAQMSHEDIEANRDAEQVEHEAEQQREQMERAARSQEQHHKDARSDVAVRGRKAMAKRARAHHHPVRDDDVAARVTNDHVDGAGADEAAIDGNALAQRLHMNAKVNPGRFNRKPAPGAGNDDAAVRSQRAQPPRARDASILVRLQSSIADVLFAVAGIVAAFYSLSYLMTVCNSRSPRKAPSKLV